MAEYVIMPKADYESACDATRAKTGKTDLIKSGELGTEIGGITVGSDIPDGTNVTFGVVERPKAYFNDVLLPAIPEDVLEQYPYAFIYKSATRYNLVFSKIKYWYQSSDDTCRNSDGTVKNYWLTFENMAAGQTWAHRNDDWYYWGPSFSSGVVWSNYDIPNGSADATEIYFEGTEPQIVPVFPEREEAYSFTSEDIANLGYAIQQKTNDYTLRTVSEYTDRVSGITSSYPAAEEVGF